MEKSNVVNKNKENEYISQDNRIEYLYIMNSPRIKSTNKYFEDSIIKEEEIDTNINLAEKIICKEKQLSILFDSFNVSFLEKSYEDLIKNIEEKEFLLYRNSMMSFKIKILKIKGYLKLLMIEYNNYLQAKNKQFNKIDEIFHKIKNEFKKVSLILNNKDSYVYEILTQIYCLFLYFLSKITKKKGDYLKCLGYVTLGINMLKIYFIRKTIAFDIKTYKIYCKLVLEVINILIGDNNYEQALYYIRLLFKIIEVSIKAIYYNNNKNLKLIPITTIKKFLYFGGIGYAYTGCCLEQLDSPKQAFEAYKQAKLFFKKGSKLGFSINNSNIININNCCSFLVHDVFSKLRIKFEIEKKIILNKQKKYVLQKKKEEIDSSGEEKIKKFKNMADIIGSNHLKYQHLENKFYRKIFPSSVKNNLEKIDNELSSLVFSYFNKNRTEKKIIASYNRKISDKTKHMLNRYKACNILLSKQFRKFITKTKKLEFYNPKSASNDISLIQRHLYYKMIINSNSKQKNNTQRGSPKLNNDSLMHFKTEHKSNLIRNLTNKSQSLNSMIKEKEKINNQKLFFNRKKILFTKHETGGKNISQIILPHSLNFNLIKGRNNKKYKYKIIDANNRLVNDFHCKNLNQSLMAKSCLNKFSYYDTLSDKELKFQKDYLYYKNNNSLYQAKNSIETKDGIIGKYDLDNISLIVDDRAKEKAKLIDDNNILDIRLIKNSFTTKQNKFTLSMKHAMSSVINKYINQKKSRSREEKKSFVNLEGIRNNNEKKLLYLNHSVNNINHSISKLEKLIKKNI